MHAVAEECGHFVPVQVMSNSRNENGEVVYGMNNASGVFATWPGTLGIAAAVKPVQIKILPISDKFINYAKEMEKTLKKEGLRCEIDERAEKIGYKIRAARLERVPYMLIVGEKEVENNSVSVRKRDDGDLGNMPINKLLEILREEEI